MRPLPADLPAELAWWLEAGGNPARRGEAARLEECDRCAGPVLAIVDLWPAEVDPRLLDTAGELEAMLAGRLTWDLWQTDPVQLVRRDLWRIRAAPAGRTARLVLASHVCFRPLGLEIPWGLLYPRAKNQYTGEIENAPF